MARKPKRLTQKQQFQRLGSFILGEKMQPATERTHPVQSEAKSEADVLLECLTFLRRYQIVCNRLNNGKGILIPYQIAMQGGADTYCRNNGCYPRVYGIVGAGDIIGILPGGRHFEVETKAGKGGTLSSDQIERRRIVTEAGGLYIVVHSGEELRAVIVPLLGSDPLFAETEDV